MSILAHFTVNQIKTSLLYLYSHSLKSCELVCVWLFDAEFAWKTPLALAIWYSKSVKRLNQRTLSDWYKKGCHVHE